MCSLRINSWLVVSEPFGFRFLSRQIHDRRSVAVQEGGMLGAPLLECMESVPSYKLISGSAFARLIQKGSFQFIKGRYFEDCWRDQQVFACRQNIPPEYLWTGDECVKLWEAHGPRFMLSISYGWLREDHPDPEMFHLKRLAKVVKAFKKLHSIDCEDCAVFLDFCSLWQKELVDGVDTRTPEQIVQFKEALDEINTPYGHEAITSVRLEAVPEGTVRTYHMRGWTEFEKRIIDCKGGYQRWFGRGQQSFCPRALMPIARIRTWRVASTLFGD